MSDDSQYYNFSVWENNMKYTIATIAKLKYHLIFRPYSVNLVLIWNLNFRLENLSSHFSQRVSPNFEAIYGSWVLDFYNRIFTRSHIVLNVDIRVLKCRRCAAPLMYLCLRVHGRETRSRIDFTVIDVSLFLLQIVYAKF